MNELIVTCGYRNKTGQTALMFAAINLNVDAVKILVTREICMQDNDGKTALMLVCQ